MNGDINQTNPNNIIPNDISQPIEQEPNYTKWIFIGIGSFFAVIILIVLIIIFGGSSEISEQAFVQGTNLELKENNKVNFEIGEEEHTLTVESVGQESVNIIIQSEPIKANLKIRETKKFDLDDDGIYDILVRLNSIIEGVPNIYIKKISEEIEEVEIVGRIEEGEETENETAQNNNFTNQNTTISNITQNTTENFVQNLTENISNSNETIVQNITEYLEQYYNLGCENCNITLEESTYIFLENVENLYKAINATEEDIFDNWVEIKNEIGIAEDFFTEDSIELVNSEYESLAWEGSSYFTIFLGYFVLGYEYEVVTAVDYYENFIPLTEEEKEIVRNVFYIEDGGVQYPDLDTVSQEVLNLMSRGAFGFNGTEIIFIEPEYPDFYNNILIIDDGRIAGGLGEWFTGISFDLVLVNGEWKFDLIEPFRPEKDNPRILKFFMKEEAMAIQWEKMQIVLSEN